MGKMSKNQKQRCMIAEATISGSASFCKLVSEVTKEIDKQCKCIRTLGIVHAVGNTGVLVNNLVKEYNSTIGSFPGAFQGSYGKKSDKRLVYYKRLFKITREALQSVYSNGNTLAGMSEKDAECAVKLFWEQLIK
ncbi:MAG: hypothetical protein HDR23_10025 [Lachnospiraceae bacterium]|nr:hypothetical protein [Lachnospiraceae bacterium]